MRLPWMKRRVSGSDDNRDIYGDVASLPILVSGAPARQGRRPSAREESQQSVERSIAAARSVL